MEFQHRKPRLRDADARRELVASVIDFIYEANDFAARMMKMNPDETLGATYLMAENMAGIWDGRGEFGGYLHRFLWRRVIERVKNPKRKHREIPCGTGKDISLRSDSVSAGELKLYELSVEHDPHEDVAEDELWEIALKGLNPLARERFERRFRKGESARKIAGESGLTRAAVSEYIRARKHIVRENLEKAGIA